MSRKENKMKNLDQITEKEAIDGLVRWGNNVVTGLTVIVRFCVGLAVFSFILAPALMMTNFGQQAIEVIKNLWTQQIFPALSVESKESLFIEFIWCIIRVFKEAFEMVPEKFREYTIVGCGLWTIFNWIGIALGFRRFHRVNFFNEKMFQSNTEFKRVQRMSRPRRTFPEQHEQNERETKIYDDRNYTGRHSK